jgi:hypothetical protein
VVVPAVRAGGQAAEQDARAKQANQGAFDPAFHGGAFQACVEQGFMFAAPGGLVLSAPYRRVSFLFIAMLGA